MARKNNRKKKNVVPALKYVIIGLFTVFIVFVVTNSLKATVDNSSLFRVKQVVKAPHVSNIESRYLDNLLGRNIFDVNMRFVHRRLQAQYPELYDLKISRRFPDQIYVDAVIREPLALIALDNKSVSLDKDGNMLSFSPSLVGSLPYIISSDLNLRPALGRRIVRQDIQTALEIISLLEEEESLKTYRIQSIDVTNLSEIDFHLSNGIKIIMDQEKIRQKVSTLGILLSQGNVSLPNVSYVDLRFKEPILGQK